MADVTESAAPAQDFTVSDYDGRMILPLASILTAQQRFSFETFGPPGARSPKDPTAGVRDHLRKELTEVDRTPHDIEEWMDVAILAFDGALRAGYTPLQVAAAFTAKNHKNSLRRWPDWRLAVPGTAIEHLRPGQTDHRAANLGPVARHPKELGPSSTTATPVED